MSGSYSISSLIGWVLTGIAAIVGVLSTTVATLYKSQIKTYEARIQQLEAEIKELATNVEQCHEEHTITREQLSELKGRLTVLESAKS